MTRRTEKALLAGAIAAIAAAGAIAGETIGYSYDARGRLVKVTHAGSVNNNVTTNYSYDKADNRTLKNRSGVPGADHVGDRSAQPTDPISI